MNAATLEVPEDRETKRRRPSTCASGQLFHVFPPGTGQEDWP